MMPPTGIMFRHIFAQMGAGVAIVNSMQNRNIRRTKCSFHQTAAV